MNLLRELFDYVILYDYLVFAGVFALLAVNFAVNMFFNAYHSTNRQIKKCKRLLRIYIAQQKLLRIGDAMPSAYRNQWNCFVYTTDVKPSEAMSFVKTKQAYLGMWVNVATLLVNLFYIACLVLNRAEYSVIPLIAAYFGVVVLLSIILHFANKRKESKSRKQFNNLATLLDFCLPDGVRYEKNSIKTAADNKSIDEAIEQIEVLRQDTASGSTLSRVSEVLRQKGLDGNRTAEQQRKLNVALNRLLQSVCKQHLQSSTHEF